MDDPRAFDRDQKDFIAARLLYLNIQKEIIGLESKTRSRNDIALTMGRPVATTISSLLAIILISAAVLKAFYGYLMQ